MKPVKPPKPAALRGNKIQRQECSTQKESSETSPGISCLKPNSGRRELPSLKTTQQITGTKPRFPGNQQIGQRPVISSQQGMQNRNLSGTFNSPLNGDNRYPIGSTNQPKAKPRFREAPIEENRKISMGQIRIIQPYTGSKPPQPFSTQMPSGNEVRPKQEEFPNQQSSSFATPAEPHQNYPNFTEADRASSIPSTRKKSVESKFGTQSLKVAADQQGKIVIDQSSYTV